MSSVEFTVTFQICMELNFEAEVPFRKSTLKIKGCISLINVNVGKKSMSNSVGDHNPSWEWIWARCVCEMEWKECVLAHRRERLACLKKNLIGEVEIKHSRLPGGSELRQDSYSGRYQAKPSFFTEQRQMRKKATQVKYGGKTTHTHTHKRLVPLSGWWKRGLY